MDLHNTPRILPLSFLVNETALTTDKRRFTFNRFGDLVFADIEFSAISIYVLLYLGGYLCITG